MSAHVASHDPRRAPLDPRSLLLAVLGPGRCCTCLEPDDSPLHHELCEVGSG